MTVTDLNQHIRPTPEGFTLTSVRVRGAWLALVYEGRRIGGSRPERITVLHNSDGREVCRVSEELQPEVVKVTRWEKFKSLCKAVRS